MEINRVGVNTTVNMNNSGAIQVEKASVENKEVKHEVVEKKEIKVDRKELDSAVDKANRVLFKNNTHLKFEIHDKTNQVMVSIIEDESGEVLKEIPPKKMLDMVAKLWEIAGIFVDEKR